MKQKMQNVSFRNVDEFLDFLPDDELRITEVLKQLVFNCVPNIIEKLSYNVPFYKLNKGLFFIWPASVLWGKKQTYKGVRFGFQQGYLLNDSENYLERGERQQIYWRTFQSIEETDVDILKILIFESVLIDKEFEKQKHG